MSRIGTIVSIARYPVKSMAGETITAGFLGYSGLFGDRAYAFVQNEGKRGFPWFTIRQYEDLVRFRARFRYPEKAREPVDSAVSLGLGVGVAPIFPDQDALDVEVETPEGKSYSIRAAELMALLEADWGAGLVLRYSERAHVDCRPLSIFSTSTAAALSEEIGVALDARRFRANLYVAWDDTEPFYENDLVGSVVQLGDRAQVMLTERDPRCKIVGIDPDTGDENPSILRHISQTHAGCAGVYGAVLREGMVQAGDVIRKL